MNWLYIALIVAACRKTSDTPIPPPVPPPVSTDTLPAQYGTPFTETPAAQDAVIYQVNMRAFSPQDNFKGVQDRLDSIRALGVNVLYLMPTYPVGVTKSVNSPYCVKDYMGVNAEFGTLADLRSLVDQAHARHMAVIFDWVADHTSWDNAWITKHPDWYLKDGAGNIISPPNTGWNDVAALNFTSADLRKAMIRAMQFWVYTANRRWTPFSMYPVTNCCSLRKARVKINSQQASSWNMGWAFTIRCGTRSIKPAVR